MTTSTASGRNIASKEYAQPYMPAGTYTPWQRPSDWLTLPSLSSTVVFVGLVAVFNDDNNYVTFGALPSTGSYTIDWGDGTSDTSSGSVVKTHNYNYNDLSSGTLTTRGYRQAIVTVTMTSGTFNGLYLTVGVTAPTLPQLNVNWLDVGLNSSTCTTISIGGSGQVNVNMLENINIQSCSSSPSVAFSSLVALQQITVPSSTIFNTNSLFTGCSSLIAAPFFNTSTQTIFNNMFTGCTSLQYVPPYDTSNATSFLSMFQNCTSLKSVPQFNTSKVLNMGTLFNGCASLTSAPYFNTSNVTSMTNMFDGCSSLTSVPYMDTAKTNTMYFMFNNCNSLKSIPLLNTSNCTVTTSMFANCSSLRSVPAFDTTKVTNSNSMFFNCASIKEIPTFNLGNVTNAATMFSGCSSMVDLSNFSAPNVTGGVGGLFNGCGNLVTLPASLDFSKSATGAMSNTFTNDNKLRGNISINVGNVTLLTSIFSGATSVTSVEITGNCVFTGAAGAFSNCKNVKSVTFANCNSVTSAMSTTFTGCTNLNTLRVPNLGVSLTISSTMLGDAALETVFNDLRGNATAQTVTITSSAGAITTGSSPLTVGQPIGSTVLGVVASSAFNIGDWATNSACFVPAAVTMQDTGDTVTRTNHGFANGTRVSFATIVSTTGISVNTIYYVVNATTNTFQVSLTNGGAPLALTTNGSGTLRFEVYIVDRPTSTTVTVSAPTTAVTTATNLVGRPLNTYLATLKNWIVTG